MLREDALGTVLCWQVEAILNSFLVLEFHLPKGWIVDSRGGRHLWLHGWKIHFVDERFIMLTEFDKLVLDAEIGVSSLGRVIIGADVMNFIHADCK
jgi:hypothetical protein